MRNLLVRVMTRADSLSIDRYRSITRANKVKSQLSRTLGVSQVVFDRYRSTTGCDTGATGYRFLFTSLDIANLPQPTNRVDGEPRPDKGGTAI